MTIKENPRSGNYRKGHSFKAALIFGSATIIFFLGIGIYFLLVAIPTIDASSKHAYVYSCKRVRRSLPVSQRKSFDEALSTLRANPSTGYPLDDKKTKALHGLTGIEVIQEARFAFRKNIDEMFSPSGGSIPFLNGDHTTVFRGEKNITAYNNHPYIIRHQGKFWCVWSCGFRDGGNTGQHVRFSSSITGKNWERSLPITPVLTNGYYIARGLWVHDEILLVLVARCTGQMQNTRIEALEAYAWHDSQPSWEYHGVILEKTLNNYPPVKMLDGSWLMSRRTKLDHVQELLRGARKDPGSWEAIPIVMPAGPQLTEPNIIIRADGNVAVHFRDKKRSNCLWRALSTNGGISFSKPGKTNFPDCSAKHFCLKLRSGIFILISNPYSRKVLQISASDDGAVFTHTAKLRYKPVPIRNPGHDKGDSFTYPHAVEHEGKLYIVYSVNRDDIGITTLRLHEIETKLRN